MITIQEWKRSMVFVNTTRYAIILNYQSENNNDIFSGKYNFLKNYKVKFRYNNCFLLELND